VDQSSPLCLAPAALARENAEAVMCAYDDERAAFWPPFLLVAMRSRVLGLSN
jgi:hypothetical protein